MYIMLLMIFDSQCSISSDWDLSWRYSIPRITKMPTLQSLRSNRHLRYHHPMLILLVIILYRCLGVAAWQYRYIQNRYYIKVPGEWELRMSQSYHISYHRPHPNITYPSRSGAQACVPLGNYHQGIVGYAVCNAAPSQTYIGSLVRDVILNNTYSLHGSYYGLSSKETVRPNFQCVSFFIQSLDENKDIRIYNLTAAPCPELSFANLLFPRTHLKYVQIYGLPLQRDLVNSTHDCPISSNLVQIALQDNGLVHFPFTSCSTTYRNLKYVSLVNQYIMVEEQPILPLSGDLIYLSLYNCSLQELYKSTFEGLSSLQVLNISHNNITSLYRDVFYNLTDLYLLRFEYNALSALDMSTLRHLKSLQYLYLAGNHLNNIDGEFAILPSLRFIDLSHNTLSVVKENTFRNSPMLKIIILDYNAISEVESHAFFNMTNFKVLCAWSNLLKNVNACNWFNAVTNIDFLILANNSITQIEGQRCLPYMRTLNLFGNKLLAIPSLRNLTQLALLDLGWNAIHDISGQEVSPATRLVRLRLDNNHVRRLGVFGNSSSIEKVFLNVNDIPYIPSSCFKGLQSLKVLNLSYNHIEYMGEFAFPESLYNLGLYGNNLSHLDGTRQNLSNLRSLYVGHNNFRKPVLFNVSLPNALYLDISENPFESTSLHICSKMPHLENIVLENLGIEYDRQLVKQVFGKRCVFWRHISLAKNRINKIDENILLAGVDGGIDYSDNPLQSIPWFRYTHESVRYLYFNNCSINTIAPMAFQNLPNLARVDLKDNAIEYFPQMSLNNVEYDLRNNPITCSCHLRWLHGNPARSYYLFTHCVDPVNGFVEVFDRLPPDRLVCQHDTNCVQGCSCFGMNTVESSTLTIVNCSSRALRTIPIGLPPEASTLYLDHNQFSTPHFVCDTDMNTSQMFLQNSRIESLETSLFEKFPSLEMIDLSYNELRVVNMDLFRDMHHLKWLFLHDNHIKQLHSAAVGYGIHNLQIITLHENELDVVPEGFADMINNSSVTNITLAGNPWQCASCAGPILREWLVQHAGIVSDAADIRCNRSHLPVLDIGTNTLEYARCVNATRTITNSHWGIAAGLSVTLVLLLVSLVLTYCYRDHIVVLLYNNFDSLKRRRKELDVPYDVRVISDENDERVRQWTVDSLLQVLEAEWGHTVFLVERDMLAGGTLADEIADSIRRSRRTLIVLSENFINNDWAKFANEAAFQFQIENRLHRVLVLAWEQVDVETMDYNIKVYFETKQVMYKTSSRFWSVLKSKLPLGRENVDQNQDGMQLNLLENENMQAWQQPVQSFVSP